ncbi:MAG TPA: FecR family protein, partial [Desulfobaccales bacterium]|nr:FecR family protein [Desulfobaccales bacterium]
MGRLTKVKGEVDLLRKGHLPAVLAKQNDPVEPGDVVRTKSGAKAQITFIDDSVLTIAPGSRIAIDKYMVSSGKRQAVLQMFRGVALAVVSKVFKAHEPDFLVKTNTAIMGVRGTELGIRIYPNFSEFLNFQGLTDVRNRSPKVQGMVSLHDWQGTRVAFGLPPYKPFKISPKDREQFMHQLETGLDNWAGEQESDSSSRSKSGLFLGSSETGNAMFVSIPLKLTSTDQQTPLSHKTEGNVGGDNGNSGTGGDISGGGDTGNSGSNPGNGGSGSNPGDNPGGGNDNPGGGGISDGGTDNSGGGSNPGNNPGDGGGNTGDNSNPGNGDNGDGGGTTPTSGPPYGPPNSEVHHGKKNVEKGPKNADGKNHPPYGWAKGNPHVNHETEGLLRPGKSSRPKTASASAASLIPSSVPGFLANPFMQSPGKSSGPAFTAAPAASPLNRISAQPPAAAALPNPALSVTLPAPPATAALTAPAPKVTPAVAAAPKAPAFHSAATAKSAALAQPPGLSSRPAPASVPAAL